MKKQQPWEESIRIPFLLHYPARFGHEGKELDARLDTPDTMPTLLGLCGILIPDTVQGLDYSGYLQGEENPSDGAALLMCPHPFGQWSTSQGGREYRGLRTKRYTYVRSLQGPWLLYDNETDPYQLANLIDQPEYGTIQRQLDRQLQQKLDRIGDKFLDGMAYIKRWAYTVDETGTVPYEW